MRKNKLITFLKNYQGLKNNTNPVKLNTIKRKIKKNLLLEISDDLLIIHITKLYITKKVITTNGTIYVYSKKRNSNTMHSKKNNVRIKNDLSCSNCFLKRKKDCFGSNIVCSFYRPCPSAHIDPNWPREMPFNKNRFDPPKTIIFKSKQYPAY